MILTLKINNFKINLQILKNFLFAKRKMFKLNVNSLKQITYLTKLRILENKISIQQKSKIYHK